MGRFISEDPIGFAAGDTNLSRYVFNSPTNYTDPTGMTAFDPTFGNDFLYDTLRVADQAVTGFADAWTFDQVSHLREVIYGQDVNCNNVNSNWYLGGQVVGYLSQVYGGWASAGAKGATRGGRIAQKFLQTHGHVSDVIGYAQSAQSIIQTGQVSPGDLLNFSSLLGRSLRRSTPNTLGSNGGNTNPPNSPQNRLLSGEGLVGRYGDLSAAGSVGDDITPHHIPSANHMAQRGVQRNDGIAINMEQPHNAPGGRHRDTFTYGNRADANMSSRDALAAGVRDARRIYQQSGLYNSYIRRQLQELIRQNRSNHPHLF